MGIDKVGIDKVGIDKVGINRICQGENKCQGEGNIMVKPPLLPRIQG